MKGCMHDYSARKRIDMLNRESFQDIQLSKKGNDVLVWLCGWDEWTINSSSI